MDDRVEVPERTHDQPAEGGREQADEALEQQEKARRPKAEQPYAPPRAGLESSPTEETAGRPDGA